MDLVQLRLMTDPVRRVAIVQQLKDRRSAKDFLARPQHERRDEQADHLDSS
jgi:hypothetical protein